MAPRGSSTIEVMHTTGGLSWLGRSTRNFLADAGGLSRLGWGATQRLFTGPVRGEVRIRPVLDQSLRAGYGSLGLVALICALVGMITALQSAYQLSQFGADGLIPSLVAISVTRELAPLLAAVIVTGRFGSSIASELATMEVSQEIDALEVMGLDPMSYLVVPRVLALIITMPCLIVFADVIGILGGFGNVPGADSGCPGAAGYRRRSGEGGGFWGHYRHRRLLSGIDGERWRRRGGQGHHFSRRPFPRSHCRRRSSGHRLLLRAGLTGMPQQPLEVPAPAAIEVRGLRKAFGRHVVLDGVDLTVNYGETLVILGGSGSGKSTLLRCMVGLEQPDEGSVHLCGEDLFQIDAKRLLKLRRRIGMAFQSGALFGSMTVGENIELPLAEFTDLPPTTRRIVARLKLGMVGLEDAMDLRPAELSGGMIKRAALARALALDPDVVFFDEPSAGLDPVTGAAIDNLMVEIRRIFEATFVVVTHEMISAFTIADRIALMHEGRFVVIGTPDVVAESEDPIVRAFLDRKAPDSLASPEKLRQFIDDLSV